MALSKTFPATQTESLKLTSITDILVSKLRQKKKKKGYLYRNRADYVSRKQIIKAVVSSVIDCDVACRRSSASSLHPP